MKLVMTLLVRNEADIIEANLEYHLAQGVDFVIVTDHGSEDGTGEILREYERMGVAKVIRDEEAGHHQSRRVTRMAELARVGHGADWVIHNDADEFWWPLVGDLRDVFSSLPSAYGQIEVKRRNFRPRADGEEGPFYSRLVHRDVGSITPSGYALESKVAHRPHPRVVVAPGNHSINDVGLDAVPAGEVLEIFHFPMREYEQFERKVLQIGLAYEQLPDRSLRTGCDQLALLELQRAGKLRDYYDGLLLDDVALERGLQIGAIVVDRRLENFMRDLHAGEHSRVRPDAPLAGAMLGRLMGALGEVEQSRAELATLRSESARARERFEDERSRAEQERGRAEHERARAEHERARIEHALQDAEGLRGRVAELNAALERSRDELQTQGQTLELLHSSRLLRSTAWARRLYYRALAKGSQGS